MVSAKTSCAFRKVGNTYSASPYWFSSSLSKDSSYGGCSGHLFLVVVGEEICMFKDHVFWLQLLKPVL